MTQPVAVEGAEPGDAIVIRIAKIRVTSEATASGTMSFVEGRYTADPFVARHCPECGAENPATQVQGIGPDAIHCVACGAEVNPFRLTRGYTIVFDDEQQMAITVEPAVAERLAQDAAKVMALPVVHHVIAPICNHGLTIHRSDATVPRTQRWPHRPKVDLCRQRSCS